jgi:hypothetical protein
MPARLRPVLLAAMVLAIVLFALPAGAQAAPTRCPGTFQVLHDDHIGKLSLRAGPYVIDVIDSSRLSCSDASDLFRQFLEDFDGKLAKPWLLNVSTRTFTRGRGSTIGFTVTRSSGTGGGGGGRYPATGKACPSFFHVLHNDHIGKLKLPAGEYRITLLSVGRISCARASRYFAQFLQDFDGKLPRPWTIDVETGSFERGSRNIGFRVKPTGNPPNPSGGGNRYPSKGQKRCAGTFRVVHRDHIGKLKLPAGPYIISTLSSKLSCGSASNLFRQFLDDPNGRLPSPWAVNTKNGTFRRGKGSSKGFRVKPSRAR